MVKPAMSGVSWSTITSIVRSNGQRGVSGVMMTYIWRHFTSRENKPTCRDPGSTAIPRPCQINTRRHQGLWIHMVMRYAGITTSAPATDLNANSPIHVLCVKPAEATINLPIVIAQPSAKMYWKTPYRIHR